MRRASTQGQLLAGFAALALAGLSGCASSGDIPLGSWVGRGLVVSESWQDAGAGVGVTELDPDESAYREYPTELTIQIAKLEGRAITEIEIISHSTTEDDPHPFIHLRIGLEEIKRVSDGIVLYRVVDARFHDNADEPLEYKENGPAMSASCSIRAGVTTLHLIYSEQFWDVFRFQGNGVEKYGTLRSENQLVQWTERLRRGWL